MKKQKTNIFDKIICIGFIIFLFQVIFHSFNASADCGKQIGILKTLEGYRAKCYPDNTQGSAGFGSGSLCKKIKKAGRLTTKKEANNHLKTVDFPHFYKQTKALKFNANQKEMCVLTTLVYNKGYGVVKSKSIPTLWNKWKKTKKASDKLKLRRSLLEMSCQKVKGRWSLNRGLLGRQGALIGMLEDVVKTPKQAESMRDKFANNRELINRYSKYCNDKNKTLNELVDEILKNNLI